MTKINKKGTSLVELLAVIVIMGIIAAIAVPSVGALITNSKRNAALESANVVLSSAKTQLLAMQASSTTGSDISITAAELETSGAIESNPFNITVTFKLSGAVTTITLGEGDLVVNGVGLKVNADGTGFELK